VSRHTLLTLVIVAVALIARLGVVATDDGYTPKHDAFDYDRHAVSIAAGDGYPISGYAIEGGPSALRAPGYPYALGATYAALGVGADGGRILNALFGALTVLLVVLLGTRIGGPRAGLIAGALAAVFPPLALLSRDLYSENLFIPIALAIPLAALRFRDGGGWRWVVAVGLLCGLSALTRNPGPAVFLPALIGVWWMRPRLSGRALAAPAVALLIACLTVVPWTIRNAVDFGRFIPVTTSTGFALAGTYNEASESDERYATSWRTPSIVAEYEPLFRTPGIDEGTLDATLRREATEFARDHPGYVAEVAWHNGLRLFMLEGASVVDDKTAVDTRGIGSGSTTGERIALALIVPFALAGAVLLARRHRRIRVAGNAAGDPLSATAFVWLIPVLVLLAAALVAGLPRYRLPADPFMLILAALAIERCAVRLAARRGTAAGKRAGAATAMLLACAAVAGCGSSDETTTAATTTTAAPKAEISKDAYIKQADAVCAKSLARTQRLVEQALGSGDGANADSITDFATDALVRPGLEIRRDLAAQLEKLPQPPPDPNLDTFLKLFPTTEALIEQRLEAGEKGDNERAIEIDTMLVDLGAEQQAAAAAYGFDDCSANFGSLQT
jgi:4-amino-4-deoxy-L-arabinose transferase-like glycosyltransferase